MRAVRDRGFTLLEILVVLGIVALLAALLFPVFTSAKERSKQTRCLSNLRQLAQAIAIYRSDNGGDAVSGDMYTMGLPITPFVSMPHTRPVWECDGTARPKLHSRSGFSYRYMAAPPGSNTGGWPSWDEYARQRGEQSIILIDTYHNSPELSQESALTTKFAIAVRLDTSIIQKRKKGLPLLFEWWE